MGKGGPRNQENEKERHVTTKTIADSPPNRLRSPHNDPIQNARFTMTKALAAKLFTGREKRIGNRLPIAPAIADMMANTAIVSVGCSTQRKYIACM